MSANSTQELAGTHPGRDVAIVSLCAVVASLVAVIVVMAFHGNPLATFGASGSAFAAAFSGGMGVLQQVLADEKWAEALTDADRRALSPLFWTHVNPYGRFELDMNSRLDLDLTRVATVPGPRAPGGDDAA